MSIYGIDVSKFNGEINWQQVRASGVEFALVQAGYGSRLSNKDARFDANVEGAIAEGIEVGAYWFSYAYTPEMARAEAELLLEIAAPYRGKMAYPLCFDWEYDSYRYAQQQGVNPTPALITDIAAAFLERIQDGGYYAMYYSNLDYYRRYYQTERMAVYDLWLADYGGTASIACGIQQTGDDGEYEGIASQYTDTDVAYKDYPSIVKQNGLNGYERPAPAPQPPEQEDDQGKEEEMIYNTIDSVPEWARPTIQKLADKGYLKGDGEDELNLNDTMLRLLVINDRAGLYD